METGFGNIQTRTIFHSTKFVLYGYIYRYTNYADLNLRFYEDTTKNYYCFENNPAFAYLQFEIFKRPFISRWFPGASDMPDISQLPDIVTLKYSSRGIFFFFTS